MRDKELLAEAKRRYPVGAVVKCLSNGVLKTIEGYSIDGGWDNRLRLLIEDQSPYYCVEVYKFRWAEIVSLPKPSHESIEIY